VTDSSCKKGGRKVLAKGKTRITEKRGGRIFLGLFEGGKRRHGSEKEIWGKCPWHH